MNNIPVALCITRHARSIRLAPALNAKSCALRMGSRNTDERLGQLLPKVLESLPDLEPKAPPGGFRVQVSKPFIADGAKEMVIRAIEDATISSATSVVREFERELRTFYGVPMAKACSSGYSALVIALKLARVGRRDTVLIPSLTMAAVLNAVQSVGASPVFVDCATRELNPEVEEYAAKITPQTRALIVAHTFGVPADCTALQTFC